jgi:hypothetical protein
MLFWRDPSITVTPGELYLISGKRSHDLIPPYAEMSEIRFSVYVEITGAKPAASAERDLKFLASTAAGATVLGTLRRHSYGGAPGAVLNGIRVVVASEAHTTETTTGEDGSFIVTGLQPGRVEIGLLLPRDLTVINKSELVRDVRVGCSSMELTADLNGRVRGRIVGASGESLKSVRLHLRGVNPDHFADLQSRQDRDNVEIVSSHAPHLGVVPNEDGRYEFSGVPPGSYVLSASIERVVNGKTQHLVTFFPGVPRFAGASLIDVGKATLHEGFDFVVRTE